MTATVVRKARENPSCAAGAAVVIPCPTVNGFATSTGSRALLIACAAVCCTLATGAWAATPTTADVERLIKRGNELRTAGKDQQALPLYEKAYQIAPTPRTAAQLGLCEMALNYWLAAEGHMSEALAGRGDWIDKNRAAIDGALQQVRKQIGELIVSGTPSGASVNINGRDAGTLPLPPIRVAVGQTRVEVTATGYRNHARR